MRNRQTRCAGRWVGWALVTIAFLGLVLTGCGTMDKEAQHRILTFFFTGVPPLEGTAEQRSQVAGATADSTAPPDSDGEAAETEQASEPQIWIHGPVAANQCDLCHTVAVKEGYRSVTITGATHRLVMPVEELCISCHEAKSAAAAAADGLKIHPPVEAGMCLRCHDAHKSRRQYLLRASSNRVLCTRCHPVSELSQTDEHVASDLDCMLCHNPHVGKTSTMLRTDFDEAVDHYGGS